MEGGPRPPWPASCFHNTAFPSASAVGVGAGQGTDRGREGGAEAGPEPSLQALPSCPPARGNLSSQAPGSRSLVPGAVPHSAVLSPLLLLELLPLGTARLWDSVGDDSQPGASLIF